MGQESPRSAGLSDAVRDAGPLDTEASRDIVAALKRELLGDERASPRIGRYQWMRTVGRGGHGVVYEANDPLLDRRVAIKVLHGATRDSATMRDRLRREAQVIAQIRHPNIALVFDVGAVVEDGVEQTYVVMEYVDGESLTSWLAGGHGSERVISAFLAAAQGLAAAHEHGVVHRDFKPGNVIVARDGSPRVVDFGVATAVGDAELEASTGALPARRAVKTLGGDLTATGEAPGTPYFMAPEQQRGERVDARADQYAWALACYAALLRRDPFDAIEPRVRLAAKLGGPPPRPRVPGVAPAVWGVLERALAPDPAERFPTMHAAIAALEHARRRHSIVAGGLALGATTLALLVLTVASRVDPCDELRGSAVVAPEVRARWGASADAGRGPVDSRLLAQLDGYAASFEAIEAERCDPAAERDAAAVACLQDQAAEVAQVLRDVDALPPDIGPFEELMWTLPATTECRRPRDRRSPKPRARTEEFVAMAYVRLGRLDEARRLARRMLADGREPTAWGVLGACAAASGDAGAAAEWYEAMYFRAAAIGSHGDAAAAAAQLVAVYASLQQDERAAEWERNAATALERVGGDARAQSILDSHVGEAAFWRGDYETAYRHQHAALVAFTRAYGPSGAPTLMARNNLATTLEELGRLDEALELHDELLAVRSASAPLSVDVYASALNLCNVLYRLGALAEAEQHCVRSLAAAHATFGSASLVAATAEVTLAEVELALDGGVSLPTDDELAPLGPALEAELVRIQVDRLRAVAARRDGRALAAATAIEAAWRRAFAVLGPRHPMARSIAVERAAIAALAGDPVALRELQALARAPTAGDAVTETDHGLALVELGTVLIELGHTSESLPVLVDATERLSATWVDSMHARRAEAALRRAQALAH